MSYYYFAATLPMLMPDQPPPFTVDDFRQQCATQLTPGDLDALDDLLDARPSARPHPFTRDWRAVDHRLRNALARARAGRLHKDADTYVRGDVDYDPEIERGIAEAYSRPTPLDREKALDRLRWQRLETLAGPDPFAGRAVLAYGLQLTILERWARMDKDAGTAAVDTLVQRDATDEEDKP